MEKLDLSNRIEVSAKTESYVTIKDTKPDFPNNPQYRLLNPNKGNLGQVSKQILQSINDRLRETTKFNQWKNSKEVIKWFNKIESKERSTFIVFDIDQFYPNISEDLVHQAFNLALQFCRPLVFRDL